ncbi:hypothetical protein CALVIDRAFT_537393 [Calocera viscosa TUFC12733]|uniref:Uncharacterized protein n=1 Tax=Calocera viscosa (strain TUFC12733) TaxID=1330018 RepID=A0A167LZR9_CALVF|nr:hypothetical protein CALVIDRAFT_537393 [Calocera viscosa TUFC12733]
MSDNCTIAANPGITGVGVRVSIYVQALLALLSAAVALYKYGMTHAQVSNFGVVGEHEAVAEYNRQSELWKQNPEAALQHLRDLYESEKRDEREEVRQTWLPVQVMGAALLVSAIIQVKLYGMDLYHALIVINLSWINNMTALGLALTDMFLANPVDFFFGWKTELWQFVPYIMCSLHLTATGAFGLWVFSNIDDFGGNPGCNSDIHYWVFGHQVSATAPGFRKAGLIISGLAICPMVNLQLELLFEIIVGFVFLWPGVLLHIIVVLILAVVLMIVTKLCIPIDRRGGLIKFLENLPIHSPARRVYSTAMPYAFMIMLFIIATEELIVINRGLVQEGEDDWTFGQTLAMFVLLPVVLDVYSKLRKAWKLQIGKKKAKEGDEGGAEGEAEEEQGGKQGLAVEDHDHPTTERPAQTDSEARPGNDEAPRSNEEITVPVVDL